MRRRAENKLIEWKNAPYRKPLLIRGARQVGKTYLITEFGKRHFNGKIFTFNFEKNPDIHSIFDKDLDSHRILTELSFFINHKFEPGNDLLFFDEIQECPKAIMALRYFYEENPEFHIIAAGSLLEFALKDISFPVGRLQMLNLNPMSFEEFLLATKKELLAENIRKIDQPFSKTITNLINDEIKKYFIVGGMPECVKTFARTGSFVDVSIIQSDLLATLRQDFSKYANQSDKRCLNAVLSSVANKVGEQLKYSRLAEGFSNPTIKKAFELLETARLFAKVKAASPAGIPLGASVSEKKFKAVFLDIGLMSNLSGFYTNQIISKQKLLGAFNGKMAEQFVGQELRAFKGEKMYYWSRDARSSSAEVDYLIEKEGEVIPVEVKSGKAGSLKSLHLLLNTFKNVKTSIVFTEDKHGELPEQKIKFLPLYCVGLIV